MMIEAIAIGVMCAALILGVAIWIVYQHDRAVMDTEFLGDE